VDNASGDPAPHFALVHYYDHGACPLLTIGVTGAFVFHGVPAGSWNVVGWIGNASDATGSTGSDGGAPPPTPPNAQSALTTFGGEAQASVLRNITIEANTTVPALFFTPAPSGGWPLDFGCEGSCSKEAQSVLHCLPPQPNPAWNQSEKLAWLNALSACSNGGLCYVPSPSASADADVATEFAQGFAEHCKGAPSCSEPSPYWVAMSFLAPDVAKTVCTGPIGQCSNETLPPAWGPAIGSWAPCLEAPSLANGGGSHAATNGSGKGKVVVPGFEGPFALVALVGVAATLARRSR
jgi:hypothetical protein